MMHGVANRELRSGSNSDGFFDRFRSVVNRWFFPRLSSWLGSDHGAIDRWLSPRGRTGTITEMGGGRSFCAHLGQCLCLCRRSWCWAGGGSGQLEAFGRLLLVALDGIASEAR